MHGYDVVIIGAGNGGLAAAVAASLEGKSVLVLERQYRPGGLAGTFRRGRFEFEISLHEFAQWGSADAPGMVRKLFDSWGIDVKDDMIPIDRSYRFINTDPENGWDADMPASVEGFVDEMEKLAPGSRPAMENLMRLTKMIGDGVDWMAQYHNDPPKAEMMLKWRDLMKCAAIPTDTMLRRLGLSDRARQIYEGYWDYLAADSENMSFAVYAVLTYYYLYQKPYVPKHRSFELVLALESRARELGAEFRYNTDVKTVDIKNGAVRGVVLADGTYISCGYVISNAYPHHVFGKMVDPAEVPERDRKLCNARTVAQQAFTFYLGLDAPLEEIGLDGYDVFFRPDGDTRRQFLASHTLEGGTVFGLTCLNYAVPDCSPEGTSIIFFSKFYMGDPFEGVTEEDYFKLKDSIAEDALDEVKRVTGVDLRPHIEEIGIASPTTFARFGGSPKGSVYGYTPYMWDGMFPRVLQCKKADHTIKGLRFVGGHGTQLDGYSQAYMCADEAVRYMCEEMKAEAKK